jgi:hypothetical protein
LGSWEHDPAERTAESVVDPLNLIQIMLAEGKNVNTTKNSSESITLDFLDFLEARS